MKLSSAVSYRENLAAAGTSEGVKKAWDTRGRGRNTDNTTNPATPKPAATPLVKLVRKTKKDMNTMDTGNTQRKRVRAAERSLADVKNLGDQSNLSPAIKTRFDKEAGVAEKILEKIRNNPKTALAIALADMHSMLEEIAHTIHALFNFLVANAPHIHSVVHGLTQAGLFSSAERPFVSLQRNLKLDAAAKLVHLR